MDWGGIRGEVDTEEWDGDECNDWDLGELESECEGEWCDLEGCEGEFVFVSLGERVRWKKEFLFWFTACKTNPKWRQLIPIKRN